VLLDLLMPGASGLVALRELSTLTPPVRTLMLTAEAGDPDVVEALQLGARGVVLKQVATETLFKAIRSVMAGEHWVCHECVGDLIERVRHRAHPAPASSPQAVPFTPRQLEIVSAIVAGGTNRDIAKQFSITPTTVKYHLTHMFEKVGVSNRIELARYALKNRIEASQPRH
jgi:two-component system, NarL family, nitrate/nitrite response regulator NarL